MAKKRPAIDCNSLPFDKLLADATANDADEILIRVSKFGHSLEAAEWQAVVKFSNRTRPWSVVVHEDPQYAIRQALLGAASDPKKETKNDPQNKTKLLRRPIKRRRIKK